MSWCFVEEAWYRLEPSAKVLSTKLVDHEVSIESFKPLLADKIKNARIGSMTKVSTLARRIGCSEEDIRAYEAGTRFPSATVIEKLEQALQLPLVPR